MEMLVVFSVFLVILIGFTDFSRKSLKAPWIASVSGRILVALFGTTSIFSLHSCSDTSDASTTAAIQVLKKELRSPSTFSLERSHVVWTGKTDDGIPAYVVRLEFDSQNGFGAMVRGCRLVALATNGKVVRSSNKSTDACMSNDPKDDKLMAETLAKMNNFVGSSPDQKAVSTPSATTPQAPGPAKPTQSAQADQTMPALPANSADPKPMNSIQGFSNIAAKKDTGVSALIGATPGLEDLINTLTKDKSSEFFSRLTGPSEDIVSVGAGAVFGQACMAHSCGDSAALYVRENGAVAISYLNTTTNELHYFSNIDQKDGIPGHLRKSIEESMKENPGLTLRGVATTNGITKVPQAVAAAPQPQQPVVKQVEQRPSPSSSSSQGQDKVARYAEELARELERASHPACRTIASNIRTLGNSSAPDYVRQRQIDSMIEKAPSICVRG